MNGPDEEFDFVIVGSGGGSMCAALYMRAAGKSVVILEKMDKVGGTTARSGGVLWVPNNPFMKRDGVPDGFAQAMTYFDNVVGDADDTPGTSPERRSAYLTESLKMLDFLIAQGIRLTRVSYWPDYYDELPGSSIPGRTVVAELFDANELGAWRDRLQPGFLPVPAMLEDSLKLPFVRVSWEAKWTMLKVGLRLAFARLTGKRYVSAGAALQGRMLQASLNAGTDMRAEAPVKELIVEDGAVRGVVAEQGGKRIRIGARLGVLVNAGGFSKNQRMRDIYQPGTSVKYSQTVDGDTGEMIEEMQRHGAALAQMDEMVGFQTTIPPGCENDLVKPGVQSMTAAPHAILVDQSGVRYQNEGGSYMAYCKNMLVRHRAVPAVPSYGIFDSQFLRKYMFAGRMPGSKIPTEWLETGYVRKADTVEGLAGLLDIDAPTLRGTIDRFNRFVEGGRDEEFQRGDRAYDRWLGKLEEGPYYAIPVYPGDIGTYGGVVTDIHARVLREDGTVIPGLYATGVSTASVMGRVYAGAGASVGPSFVWGYVAAKHAAGAGQANQAD